MKRYAQRITIDQLIFLLELTEVVFSPLKAKPKSANFACMGKDDVFNYIKSSKFYQLCVISNFQIIIKSILRYY